MATSTRRSRNVFIVLGVLMVGVGLAVVRFVPRERPEKAVASIVELDAVIRLRVTVDAVDGARGTMKVRLAAGPTGRPLPPEGITLFTDIDSVSTVKLQPNSGPQEASIEVPLEKGDISAYPFDTYETSVRLSAERGNPARPSWQAADDIPLELESFNSAVGFDVDVDPKAEGNNSALLVFQANRTKPTVTWVSIMMAVYWLLSFAVIGVAALVIMGLREWESRHLAWLATMIFAFASFRATAPGSPPVGVYLDYAAFFWAEVIVALTLMALVGFYLLGLRDPDRRGNEDEVAAGGEPSPPAEAIREPDEGLASSGSLHGIAADDPA